MAVDIVVNETVEEVTINVTPNVIEVNITRQSGGGGGDGSISVSGADANNEPITVTGITDLKFRETDFEIINNSPQATVLMKDILIKVSELPTVDILTTKIYVLPNDSWNWYNGTTWVTNESGGNYLINQIQPTANVTGTTVETILYTWFVPANTFSETDRIVVEDFTCVSNGTILNNAFARIRFNTVNVLPTTNDKLFATFTLANGSGNRYFRAERTIDFVDSEIKGYFNLSSSYTDKLTALYTSNYFDTTVDNYLFFTIKLGNVNDSVYMKNLIIRR